MFDLADLPRPVVRYAVGLWRRRWAAMIAAWALALIGWFGVWLLPDKYESRAQVFVQTESILQPVMTGVTAQPNYERRVEVMRQQLLTRPNVEEVIYRSGLDKTVKARSEIERRVKMEKLVDWVAGQIQVESPQEMYFNITYRFGDRDIARNVVDAVLNLLIEQDLGASLQEKEEARRLLDAEIARFDERLTAKEREVAEFRRNHAEELAVVQGNARQRELREADLARIRDDLAREEGRVATLRNLLSATARTSSGSELDSLKVQLAQLRSQYNENYPDIQNLKARIEQLENGPAGALPANPEYKRIATEFATAQGSVDGLKAAEARVRAELAALAVTIGEAPQVEAELQQIVRDYEQTRKSYEELLERRDRLALTSSLGAGGRGVEYKVFERPTPALTPAAPPRLLLILGVLAFALAGGVGVALAMTHFDKTYTQPADVSQAFGLPVLGAVSIVETPLLKQLARKDRLRLAGAFGALALVCFGYIYVEVLRLPSVSAAGAQTASLASSVRGAM
ncbi:MAG: XrtA system polysaccharide chain length determinant [Pseudomonadota bacterium]|nr:XrtA system polysaccharide chain length determinant [Pseudomonadota bacterium]